MSNSQLLVEIDSLKEEATKLGSTDEARIEKFWKKFRLEFNYNSNHLEGNTLTFGHTQLLLIFDRVAADYSLRELEEMKAHDVAMKMVKEAAEDPTFVLTEKFIRDINKIILVREFYKEAVSENGQATRRLIVPGEYKKFPNSVLLENGEIFSYSSPQDTPILMGDLLQWLRKEMADNELHPIEIAALLHYKFVRIHPFDDSNGRTSRLLMNFVLLRYGYSPIVIESADKKNYLAALNRADIGEINGFVDYIIQLAYKWQRLYLAYLNGDYIDESEYLNKEIELLKKKLKTSQKKLEVKLDSDVLRTCLRENIAPFFNKFLARLNVLKDLFFNQEIGIDLNSQKYWKELSENHISAVVETLSDSIQTVENTLVNLKVVFTEFKQIESVDFKLAFNLQVQFFRYEYEISNGDPKKKVSFRERYDQDITLTETDEFISKLLRSGLDEIKDKTGIGF